jgi:alpha-N-arabinofuranosidase
MEMFNVHQDATMLPVDVVSNDYTFNNEKLKAISASASRDSSGVVHISLVNIDAKKAQDFTLDLRGGKFSNVTGRILTSAKVQDHNTFENPEKIKPAAYKGVSLSGNSLKGSIPPYSVVVLTLK